MGRHGDSFHAEHHENTEQDVEEACSEKNCPSRCGRAFCLQGKTHGKMAGVHYNFFPFRLRSSQARIGTGTAKLSRQNSPNWKLVTRRPLAIARSLARAANRAWRRGTGS